MNLLVGMKGVADRHGVLDEQCACPAQRRRENAAIFEGRHLEGDAGVSVVNGWTICDHGAT
jgi:hypothetical protein